MTTSPDLTAILQELAAGRIDAAEAGRRLDALSRANADTARADVQSAPEPTAEPAEPPAAAGSVAAADPVAEAIPLPNDADAWAAETDRPQRAGQPIDDFPTYPPPGSASTSGSEPSDPAAADAPPDAPRPVNTSGVERITVRAVGRRVRIVGESSVTTLSADGPHVLRRNGAVLEVSSDGELGASLDGFSILRAPRTLDDIRSLGLGKELFLRVNPAIAVDVELTAGSLNTEGVPHLGKVRVTAGAAKLLDVSQIDDALVQAGQATIKGTITSGRSRVRVESGSLSVHLGDDSNVTIHGDTQLGRVSWSGGHSGAGDEVVMGNGNARLDVEVVMGQAMVKVGSDDSESADR